MAGPRDAMVEVVGFSGSMPVRGPDLRAVLFRVGAEALMSRRGGRWPLARFEVDARVVGSWLPTPIMAAREALESDDSPLALVVPEKVLALLDDLGREPPDGVAASDGGRVSLVRHEDARALFSDWRTALLDEVDRIASADQSEAALEQAEDICWTALSCARGREGREGVLIRIGGLGLLSSKTDTLRHLIAAADADAGVGPSPLRPFEYAAVGVGLLEPDEGPWPPRPLEWWEREVGAWAAEMRLKLRLGRRNRLVQEDA